MTRHCSPAGASAQWIYLGYTLGGDAMQTGFAADYLSSDPRSSNPARYLRRDEASNARGQMLTSRFGSGDGTQAFQWLVSEYDMATGWLLLNWTPRFCYETETRPSRTIYSYFPNNQIFSFTSREQHNQPQRAAKNSQCCQLNPSPNA